MPHNSRPFEFLKLFFVEEFFHTLVNKTDEYAEKVIPMSRPLRPPSILNLRVTLTSGGDEKNH